MSCTEINNCVDCQNCGCITQTKGNCVFYQGANLNCLNITKGDNYDSILVKIDDIICGLTPPPPTPDTIVTGCSNVVVTNPSTNTYNVCISPSVISDITNNTTNIAQLSNCVDAGVLNILSTDGSVVISLNTASIGCGRILDLSVPSPSLPIPVDGIIFNDFNTAPANSGSIGFDQVLKTSSNFIGTYFTSNGFNIGDEIRFTANGQVIGDGTMADIVKLDLFDGVSGIMGVDSFSSFNVSSDAKSSWEMEGKLTITNASSGSASVLMSVKLFRNSLENGEVSGANRDLYVINKEITGIDLPTLEIRIKYVRNVSATLASENFAKQLMLEVRKKI